MVYGIDRALRLAVRGVDLGADYAYNPKSKVSASGQRAIYDEGNALAAQSGGKRQTLIDALNALMASGGISAQDANQAAKEHGQGGGNIFTDAIKSVTDAASSAGKIATDVSHGNLGGAANDLGAAVKQQIADAGATASHLGQSIGSAFTDAVNGVAGAFDTLQTLVKGLTPAKLVAEVEKDLGTFQTVFDNILGVKGLDHAGDSIDLTQIPIPKSGAVAAAFPSKYRGQTVRWVEARKNAGTLLWYLAALALVEPLHLRNILFAALGQDFKKIAGLFGVKSFDHRRDHGFEPITATIAANLPIIIPVALAVLTAAVGIIAAIAGPNTVVGKILKPVNEALHPLKPGEEYDPHGNPRPIAPLGMKYQDPPGTLVPDPAYVPPAPPPPPPLTQVPVGHSSDVVTYAVIGLMFVLGGVLVYVIAKPKKPKL